MDCAEVMQLTSIPRRSLRANRKASAENSCRILDLSKYQTGCGFHSSTPSSNAVGSAGQMCRARARARANTHNKSGRAMRLNVNTNTVCFTVRECERGFDVCVCVLLALQSLTLCGALMAWHRRRRGGTFDEAQREWQRE